MKHLFFCFILLVASAAPAQTTREFTVDLWDWTHTCRDLETFKAWCADLKKLGCTRVEFSAPWNLLEPRRGEYDLTFITDRIAAAKANDLGVRIRINSYHSGATPAWYDGDFWKDQSGNSPAGISHPPPSLTDRRFWQPFGALCTHIAAKLKGEDVFYSPFIATHAELKFGDWWNHDASTLELWKSSHRSRPLPPIPPETNGVPDTDRQNRALIAFREQILRGAARRFTEALRAGDPDAKISVPLGESFRRGSAQMSNLDYFGLSRGAAQVVHSYDFFWHTTDDAWHAAASVAAFKGITGIDDVVFEFDGPALIESLGYKPDQLSQIASAALSQGAGLKGSNYSYSEKLPSTYPMLTHFSGVVASAATVPPKAQSETILLFISKWANYCYREKTEWLHDAQLGAWHMLNSREIPVRIVCEDNLNEDLSPYRGLYVAFSPPPLLPGDSREKLRQLVAKLPCIIELDAIPKAPPMEKTARPTPRRDGNKLILDHAFAYAWLHAGKSRPGFDHDLDGYIRQTWGKRK